MTTIEKRVEARERFRSRGFTLVELLVSLAVVGLLIAILLPAIQYARETSRRLVCANNLRHVGLAFSLHHDSLRRFPSDGWGWRWVGDPNRGSGLSQPGGWCFAILPFVDAKNIYDGATGSTVAEQRANRSRMLMQPIKLFYCPSRRTVGTYPYTLTSVSLVNADAPWVAAKTDYAICAGDVIRNTPSGPASEAPADIDAYPWPLLDLVTGVSYVRTETTIAELRDGSSHCLLVGEKYLSRNHYQDGMSLGDDQSAYIGDDADIRRWAADSPLADDAFDEIQLFGGPHRSGCQVVLGDGSVELVSFSVDPRVFRALGNRHDGLGYDRQ